MFEVVFAPAASRPARNRYAFLAGSLAFHSLLLLGLLRLPAVLMQGEVATAVERVDYFSLPPLFRSSEPPAAGARGGAASDAPSRAEREEQAARARAAAKAAAEEEVLTRALSALSAPALTGEATHPDPGPTAATLAARSGALLDTTAVTPEEMLSSDAPIFAAALPHAPRLMNPNEMHRLWAYLYPRKLSARGIEGETVVVFTIGTDGRVEPASLSVITTTHEAFALATLKGVLRLRFRPAFLEGHPVRVRASLPVHWRLESI